MLCPHRNFAAAYLDDVIIHLSTWADHLHHLKSILGELWKVGMTVNSKKCHLGLTEVQYLGYYIGQGLLKPQEKKMKAVQNYPGPPPSARYVPSWGQLGITVDLCPASPL